MDKARKRLENILQNYNPLTKEDLNDLDVVQILFKNKKKSTSVFQKFILSVIFLIAFIFYQLGDFGNLNNCFLDAPPIVSKLFRPPENCQICENVFEIPKIKNISNEEFELSTKNFKPLVITDATSNWTAMKHFNFNFFKDLYDLVQEEESTCQFFPYKTEFQSLLEALNMSEDRANLKEGEKPWYIGWSNCFNKAGQILNQYYERPYFLSDSSENIPLSWIFMGGPGNGAPLHVDNVYYSSWQAQIKGQKRWYLAPPPECIHKCNYLEVTIQPGEIFILDTNKWYHQTTVVPGEISITIGAEFD